MLRALAEQVHHLEFHSADLPSGKSRSLLTTDCGTERNAKVSNVGKETMKVNGGRMKHGKKGGWAWR